MLPNSQFVSLGQHVFLLKSNGQDKAFKSPHSSAEQIKPKLSQEGSSRQSGAAWALNEIKASTATNFFIFILTFLLVTLAFKPPFKCSIRERTAVAKLASS